MPHLLPFTAADLPHLEAIRPSDWPDILTPFTYYLAHPQHCLPIKLVVDGLLAGTGALILHEDTAWLGHVIVAPQYRGQGLGKDITRKLVEMGRASGRETLYLIATELGAPVYAAVGFVEETEYIFHQLPCLQPHIVSDLVISVMTEGDWAAVFAMDREAMGESRNAAMRPHLDSGLVCREGGEVTAYHLPTWGDGLIVARTAEAGKALMRHRLTTKDMACLPKDNLAAAALLESLGSKPFRAVKKMRVGPERPWRPEMIYNRIAGNLG